MSAHSNPATDLEILGGSTGDQHAGILASEARREGASGAATGARDNGAFAATCACQSFLSS